MLNFVLLHLHLGIWIAYIQGQLQQRVRSRAATGGGWLRWNLLVYRGGPNGNHRLRLKKTVYMFCCCHTAALDALALIAVDQVVDSLQHLGLFWNREISQKCYRKLYRNQFKITGKTQDSGIYTPIQKRSAQICILLLSALILYIHLLTMVLRYLIDV